MAVAIRLQRGGAKKRPYYRIVVTDKRMPRDGRFIEKVGTFNPMLAKDNAERLTLKKDRIEHWLKVGAQPSERVHGFLHKEGILEEAFDVSHRPQKSRKRPDKKTRKELKAEADEAAKAEAEAAPAEEAPAEEAEAAPAEEPKAEEAPAEEAAAEEAVAEESAEETKE